MLVKASDTLFLWLQPENLLYGSPAEDAPLKIADFGLSKILTNNATMQTVCGTPGYCGKSEHSLSYLLLNAVFKGQVRGWYDQQWSDRR